MDTTSWMAGTLRSRFGGHHFLDGLYPTQLRRWTRVVVQPAPCRAASVDPTVWKDVPCSAFPKVSAPSLCTQVLHKKTRGSEISDSNLPCSSIIGTVGKR